MHKLLNSWFALVVIQHGVINTGALHEMTGLENYKQVRF